MRIAKKVHSNPIREKLITQRWQKIRYSKYRLEKYERNGILEVSGRQLQMRGKEILRYDNDGIQFRRIEELLEIDYKYLIKRGENRQNECGILSKITKI